MVVVVVGMEGMVRDRDRDKGRRSIRLFNNRLIKEVVARDMVLVDHMEGGSMWTSRISSSNNSNMLDSSNRNNSMPGRSSRPMPVSWLGSKCMRWEIGVIPREAIIVGTESLLSFLASPSSGYTAKMSDVRMEPSFSVSSASHKAVWSLGTSFNVVFCSGVRG